MVYDLIIIGAGAAGLFAGASLHHPVNGLILEKKSTPGKKLLMSGSGQCNLTHGGNIKDFIPHYGKNGPLIRSILYQYNNLSVMDFFEKNGIPIFQRDDEKIFPRSLKAQDILGLLTDCCSSNGLRFLYSSPVDRISYSDKIYTVSCGGTSYETAKLIIASGGCSYPSTGSDGSAFSVLNELGIEIVPPAPALVPVYVNQYPYQSLAGISFPQAEITIHPEHGAEKSKKPILRRDALLFTHTCFSGPAVLNLSRHISAGDLLSINYCPLKSEDSLVKELSQIITGNKKQLITVLYDFFNAINEGSSPELPRRFLELICRRAELDTAGKASRTSLAQLKSLIRLLVHDQFRILKLGGFETAMVTAGGVALSEINLKTMESIKYPGLFFAGEVLDVDGDTGGYNLQFAFSSGRLSARNAVG